MHKRIVLIVSVLFCFVSAAAQQQDNIITIDQKTYALWQQKDWKNLIKSGNAALKKGFDFYYLRVRLGIAYFERKNYHKAAKQFETARKFNNSEDYVNEYLYYSYLLGGMGDEARKLTASFSNALKDKIGIKSKSFLRELRLYYNYNINPQKINSENFTINNDTLNGQQFVNTYHHAFNFSFTHDITPAFSLEHGYTYVNQHYFLYRQKDLQKETNNDYSSNVHQYFVSGNVRLAKNLFMGLGAHYVGIRYATQNFVRGPGGRRNQTVIATEHDGSVFIHLRKQLPYFTTGASFYYSFLNNANQFQTDLKLGVFPLGNLNFYTGTILSWQYETKNKVNKQRVVLQQDIGGKIFKNLWIEGYGMFGDMQNFITANGQVIYNDINAMKLRTGARFIILTNKRLRFNIDYSFCKFESYFNSETNNNKIKFNIHSITGGIIWDFSKIAK